MNGIDGNDLVILHGFYVKHIGNFKLKINMDEIINSVITRYNNFANYNNPIWKMDDKEVMKLRKVVYLDKLRIQQLRNCNNLLEVYRLITNWMT